MRMGSVLFLLIAVISLTSCAPTKKATLKGLAHKPIEYNKKKVETVEPKQVMKRYRQFIDDAPVNHPLYSDALNRLADLEMIEGDKRQFIDQEKQYADAAEAMATDKSVDGSENYKNAIELYENLIKTQPNDRRADWVMYQLSRAYEQSGDLEGAVLTLQRLLSKFPNSQYMPESRFRVAEMLYVLRDYKGAESAYRSVVDLGSVTPFYDKAVYKLGWSLFKQERYSLALQYFFISLKLLPISYGEDDRIQLTGLSQLQKDLMVDVFRAINLSFSYLGGSRAVVQYFERNQDPRLEYEVFSRLGEYYQAADRIEDAADTFGAYVVRHRGEVRAAEMQLLRLRAYIKGGYNASALHAREEFVRFFAARQAFWDALSLKQKRTFGLKAKSLLVELSTYYHAVAQKTKKAKDIEYAIKWYETLVGMFPGEETLEQQLLLAELYYKQGQYSKALRLFETIAYDLPKRPNSAEAGYSALLSHEKMIRASKRGADLYSAYVESAFRFITWFAEDKRVLAVRSSLAERLFALKRFDEALLQAKEIVRLGKSAPAEKLVSAYLLIGHIGFDRENYDLAVGAYEKVLASKTRDAKLRQVRERLSIANFKLAEQQQKSGDFERAAEIFMRSANTATDEDIRAKAIFDAVTAHINREAWKSAIPLVEDFLKKFPRHELIGQMHEKRIYVYESMQTPEKALESMQWLATREKDLLRKRDLLRDIAELYKKQGALKEAIVALDAYRETYTSPHLDSLEALNEILSLNTRLKRFRTRDKVYRQIIRYVDRSDLSKTDRGRYLAAQYSFVLAERRFLAYQKIKLTLPLKKSLRSKKKAMQGVLNDFEKVSSYNVSEFSTASTHRVAQVYSELGKALMVSARPRGLNAEELEMYNLELEEQAFPFEEKAIELFEVNALRVKQGLYDEWVKQSMDSLSRLQPVRYAKEERFESVIEGIF